MSKHWFFEMQGEYQGGTVLSACLVATTAVVSILSVAAVIMLLLITWARNAGRLCLTPLLGRTLRKRRTLFGGPWFNGRVPDAKLSIRSRRAEMDQPG